MSETPTVPTYLRVRLHKEWLCPNCGQTWEWRPKSKKPKCEKCERLRGKGKP